jgi:hypothetical protein
VSFHTDAVKFILFATHGELRLDTQIYYASTETMHH